MQRWNRHLKKIGNLEISYLPQAPDHGRPELAVVLGRRIVPVALDGRAQALWENPLNEAGFRALAEQFTAPVWARAES